MKQKGILITVVAGLLFALSTYDLFGSKTLPVGLTVPAFIFGTIFLFAGPAISLLSNSEIIRKKIEKRALIISLLLIGAGAISFYAKLPGGRIEIILGVLILCFFYGTLVFKNKYEKWKIFARSKWDAFFLSMFDFLGIALLLLGMVFKIQHWPYADIMSITGVIVLGLGMISWNQKFKKEVIYRKETEDKLKSSLEQIELQHKELEEKQKEIIDSIRYAKRIQHSQLPTDSYISSVLQRLKK
ncbi:MAG: protein serine/threonine phosphatase [Bacteroidota bacterium]|jgi:hypothetical protein|nr:protein serine/threonine phosphatase [Bacteroidota bacterium]